MFIHKVQVDIEFEYAHRLMQVDGSCYYDKTSCGSNHGHSGVARITLGYKKLNAWGFVVDFKQIKTDIRNWIMTNWDHSTLLHSSDLAEIKHRKLQHDKLFVFPEGMTASAECMSQYLFSVIRDMGYKDMLLSVSIQETRTSIASFEKMPDMVCIDIRSEIDKIRINYYPELPPAEIEYTFTERINS